ncbi:MAG TPA: EipA family protein [Gammaproteobacteria bacterium]|nr:EipA family protein [Gammaproteobacteria bacterium]
MRTRCLTAALLIALTLAGCASQSERAARSQPLDNEPFQQDTVLLEAETFFGRSAQGLADVLNRVLGDNGPPDGYIKGEEGAGSFGFGLRYGHGTLFLKDGTTTKVYWRGTSVGIDVGGSAAKAFVLVYDLPNLDALFQRFGGVEGSLYYVGGIGVTYNRSNTTVLAPVRAGVGWRQGVSVGYLHLSPRRSWLPF